MQVLRALPPSRLAGAMTAAPAGDMQEGQLVAALQWVHAWTADAVHNDPDTQCQATAAACASLQGDLADKALHMLESGGPPSEPKTTELACMRSPNLLISAMQGPALTL